MRDAFNPLATAATITTSTTGSWVSVPQSSPLYGLDYALTVRVYGSTAGNTYAAVIQTSTDQTAATQVGAFTPQTATTATTSAATANSLDQTITVSLNGGTYVRLVETLGAGVTCIRDTAVKQSAGRPG